MHNIDYRYVRPRKADVLKTWYDEPFQKIENPQIWIGRNATILPLRKFDSDNLQFGRGGVMDSEGNYVEMSGIDGRIQYTYPAPNPEYKDEKVVYCGYLIHQWGHFLIEGVSRLWYFLENDPSIDKYVFFLDENEQREIRGNYREFLELLKVWDKLELINKPTTYREVVVPQRGYICRSSFSPKMIRMFDTIAENVTVDSSWETPEKIYYSRSQFKKGLQFEFGFEVLDNFFEKNGYKVLYPEKVPLGQMIHYIRNSKVVASLSGSLTHNMFFARNGQTIEILERQVISDDNQMDINRMRQLHAVHIDANIPIYTIDCVGPYIMGYTDCMQRFSADNNYLPPDEQYLTEKHYKKCFVQYMKAYKDLYRYKWFYTDWYAPFADSQREGFEAGYQYFGDYLNGSKPFFWHHYFELHYFKQFLKQLLRKVNL